MPMSKTHRIIFAEKKDSPQPLNGVDILSLDFVNYSLLFDHTLDEKTLVDSLKKALSIYPYFSGRIKDIYSDCPIVTACDSGISFTTESYSEDILCFTSYDSHYLQRCHIKPESAFVDEDTPLLQLKLSKYCNGSIISFLFHHTLCDAQSFFRFLVNWGKLAREESPSIVSFDRRLIQERTEGNEHFPEENIPVVKVNQDFQPLEKVGSKRTFRISKNFIDSLVTSAKAKGIKDRIGLKHSLLKAFIWKLISLNYNSKDEARSILLVYDTRALLKIGRTYFGNAQVLQTFEFKQNVLLDVSIETIAEEILTSYYDLIENPSQLYREITYLNALIKAKTIREYDYEAFRLFAEGKAIAINDMHTQPIYDIDFGSGPAVWFEHLDRGKMNNYIEFFPAPEKNGDIILFTTLHEDDTTNFPKYFSAIDN